MRADLEEIARIARSAAEFEWQWTTENAEQAFFASVGWRPDYTSDAYIELLPGPGQPIATVFATYGRELYPRPAGTDRSLQEVAVVLVGPAVEPVHGESAGHLAELTDLFADVAERLRSDLGAPTTISPGYREMRWNPGQVVIALGATDRSVWLKFENPTHRRELDQLIARGRYDDDEDDLLGSHEGVPYAFGADPWAGYAEAVAGLLARLPTSSTLRLRSPENRIAVFTMDYDTLVVSIPDYAPATTGISVRSDTCDSPESYPQDGSEWRRSVAWPGRHREYRAIADRALAVLRGGNDAIVPADTRFEAWAYDDAKTPDTGVLGRVL